MGSRISVFNSAELQGVILALKGMDKEIAKQVRAATKSVVDKVWRDEVAQHATTKLEVRALANTARVAVSNQNVTLKAAQSTRALRGGLVPRDDYPAVEFGSNKAHQLRRHNPKGYVVYPTVADVVPRIASLWVQTVVRTFHELIEKR